MTRLTRPVAVLIVIVVFLLAGEWYFGNLSIRLEDRYAVGLELGEVETSTEASSVASPAPVPVPNGTGATDARLNEHQRLMMALIDSRRRRRLKDVTAYRQQNALAANVSSNVGLPSTFESELDLVLTRMDTCLATTNMSAYFQQMNLLENAQSNARQLLLNIRQVIPKFEVPYTVPCWNTKFIAKQNLKDHYVTGSVGNFNFSYSTQRSPFNERNILKGVQWRKHNPTDLYIKQSSACLPKIFLLGYLKCGSTFLYCLLRRIFMYTLGTVGKCEVIKEPHWWIMPGPHKRVEPLEPDYTSMYLLNFHPAAKFWDRRLPVMTIDASPNIMFHSPRFSTNESMLHNYCLIPSLMPVVLPDSRYFVIMRNPISMLYSAFWFSCTTIGYNLDSVKYRGPDLFHDRITAKIEIFNKCKNQGQPLDVCVNAIAPNLFSPELPKCGRTRLEMGLYYFHTRKWLSVIPRSRIHFFTLEEVASQDPTVTADIIIDFLELPRPSGRAVLDKDDLRCNENSQSKVDYKHDPRLQMRPDTRQILEDFFQPYNQMLAELLGDDKFLWRSNA